MGALSRERRALVVVSSDLRELMLICDRIAVMSAGRLTGIFERENWTQDALLAAAFAGHLGEFPSGATQPPGANASDARSVS
jgi:ribose transport system ATP-binding protein